MIFALFAFILVVSVILLLEPVAHSVGLVDVPGGRKTHRNSTPLIGGLAMFTAFVITLFFMSSPTEITLILLSAILVILGCLDDYMPRQAGMKFFVQAVVVTIAVSYGDVRLNSMGNIFFLGELKTGILAIPITIFALLSVINAINMIDGVDGLAGTLSLIAFTAMACLTKPDSLLQQELLILIAVLLGFLIFNLRLNKKGARIFMGDAGSMFLGFLLGWFAIRISQTQEQAVYPVTMLWLLAIPLFDFLTVFLRRVIQDKGLSKPGHDHIHYRLANSGFSKKQVYSRIVAAASLFALIGVVFQHWHIAESLSFVLFLGLYVSYYFYTLRRLSVC